MQNKTKRPYLAYSLLALLLLAAVFYVIQPYLNKKVPVTATTAKEPPKPDVPQIPVPDFNSDSTFLFLKKQVDFGPRVPNTPAQRKCADWFIKEFKRFGLTVVEQKFQARHYQGTYFNGINIIGQYKPELEKRILIAAHWDSRFQATKDTKNKDKPIDGADDGASGAAILLELARTLAGNPVDVGVDLFLIDLEDQGNEDSNDNETWCLGAQYWSKNIHRPSYSPYYAILLDMVGASGARFYKEGFSREVAPEVVNMVWNTAISLGYGEYFINQDRGGITDDHAFISRDARIPMIDIISTPNDGQHPFGSYHHTHNDNISIIDKKVLKAVGQTMTTVIYKMHNGTL
jgi:glutaminyl-peptide cyclotransferase